MPITFEYEPSINMMRFSAGLTSDVTVHDNEDNTITVSEVTARLFTTTDYTGEFIDCIVAGGIFSVPINTTRYIVVNYNNGVPVMQCITDSANINESNVIPVTSVFNDNAEIHYRTFDYWAIGALNKHNQRLVYTRKYLRQSGLSISESGTRYLTVSAGKLWYGIKQYVTGIVTTAVHEKFYQWYHDPSAPSSWTNVKISQSYNNTHFDDILLGYKEMTGGKYGVNWIYLMVTDDENELMYTMSRYEYNSVGEAQAATIPTAPTTIDSHCLLVGRVIFLKGAATGLIESAFDTTFTGSQISEHNSLTNLQGGQADEYYHLEKTEHDTLTDGSDADALHIHDSKADKVSSPTNGNFAGLDASGNLTDSGKKDADYSTAGHTHDSRYYTESEMDISLAGKSGTSHTHDDRYFTETELDNGQLDNLYYGTSAVDTLLLGKSGTAHNHNDLYYGTSAVDTLLLGKSGTSHTHDGRYYTETALDNGQLDNRYYTETELDNGQLDNLYYGTSAVDTLLDGKSGTAHNHNDLYYGTSAVDTLLDGKSGTSHTHDDRYYTETELNNGQLDNLYYGTSAVDTLLLGKSGTSHTHDDRYFTETELNNGQLDNLYYGTSAVDTLLLGKSGTGHNHNDLYYGTSAVDTLLLGKSGTAHNHNDLYYGTSAVDTLLLGKSSTSHNHNTLYYGTSAVDTLLLGKSSTSHTHLKAAVTDFVEANYVHVTGNESIAGDKTFTGQLIRPWGGLTLSTTNNNVVIGDYKNFRITGPTGNFTISGLQGGVDGRDIVLYNTVGYRMTLTNEGANSSAANRITTLSGGDFQTTTQGVVNLVYDGAASRWIITGTVT